MVEHGQTTVLATVTPDQAGDTLSLAQTAETDGGVLSLQDVGGVEEVIYTAPGTLSASGTDAVAYTVTDTTGGGTVSGAASVTLDAGPQLIERNTTLVACSSAVSYSRGSRAGLR